MTFSSDALKNSLPNLEGIYEFAGGHINGMDYFHHYFVNEDGQNDTHVLMYSTGPSKWYIGTNEQLNTGQMYLYTASDENVMKCPNNEGKNLFYCTHNLSHWKSFQC